MSILQQLSVDSLALRGAGVEFNKFSRMFKSKAEALQSVIDGDYTPTPGVVNAVIILGEGIMIYSQELSDFVRIAELTAATNQASKYINLDGVNDHIAFDNTGDVLDFSKDWSIGVTLVGVTGAPVPVNMTLFSRGGVHITLKAQAGSNNWGLYVTSDNDLYNADLRAQANTWCAPQDFSRILFTYSAADNRLRYYLGEPSVGTYTQKANLLIPQTMIDGQNINSGLSVGKGWDGEGGSAFSGVNWHGGLNNLILSNIQLTGPHLVEYFQTGESFESMELYPDLTAYCKLGEDTYPSVSDEKSLLTNGKLINGSLENFKYVPTE